MRRTMMIKVIVTNYGTGNSAIQTELDKVLEENNEIREAIANGESRERIIEESMDQFQASISLLYALGMSTSEMEEAFAKHFAKLRSREVKIAKIASVVLE